MNSPYTYSFFLVILKKNIIILKKNEIRGLPFAVF